MNKQEFVKVLAEKLNVPSNSAKTILETVVTSMKEAIFEDGELKLPELGVFKIKESAERMGRNPRTGEETKIPARKNIKFKVSKSVKDKLLEM